MPDAIGGLISLQELALDHNQLREVPAAIGGLGSLQQLWLKHNQLREVPEALARQLGDRLFGLQLDERMSKSKTAKLFVERVKSRGVFAVFLPFNACCAWCWTEEPSGPRWLDCGGCKAVSYCCKEPAKLHWKNSHKQLCGGVR